MTVLSAHQPAFMAYPGYYRRVAKSDIFVFMTGVQFERGSFINRNVINGPNGNQWLTVPLMMNGHMSKRINQMEVARAQPWRRKHRAMIQHAYAKAPLFKQRWPRIQEHYDDLTSGELWRVCSTDFAFWTKEYGLGDIPVILNNTHKIRSEELVELCQEYGADTYLSGPLGRNYVDRSVFEKAGIELKFDFTTPNKFSILHYWLHSEETPWKARP